MAEPYLTIAEINAKYPNSWVLIGNPTTRGRSLAATGGQVIFHCATRDEFYQRFEAWPGDPAIKHTASWYTGEVGGRWEVLPADTEPGAA
jgi:hypothetical protein